ncbi:hypothetical protein [Parashewanella tropica]|uniref:hypothetical protein n=1 Tax=Parashewanella tropica TaxID=2547970 RepID=UPI001059E73F|nr:hypothetical protein [Parashewanella tropica]
MGAGVDLGAAIAVSYNAVAIDIQSAREQTLEAVKGFISDNKLIEDGEFIVIGQESFMIQVKADNSVGDVIIAFLLNRPLVPETRVTLSYGGGKRESGILGTIAFLLKNISSDIEWKYFEEAGEQLLTELKNTEKYQVYAKQDEHFESHRISLLEFLDSKQK